MPLSAWEAEQLRLIEEAMAADDPQWVEGFTGPAYKRSPRQRRRRPRLCWLIVLTASVSLAVTGSALGSGVLIASALAVLFWGSMVAFIVSG